MKDEKAKVRKGVPSRGRAAKQARGERGNSTFRNLKIPRTQNFSEKRNELVGRSQVIKGLNCNVKEIMPFYRQLSWQGFEK